MMTLWFKRYSSGAMAWFGCDNMPGWKMAARFCEFMRFWSDFAANTASKSRM
jgi:hypothetical protein